MRRSQENDGPILAEFIKAAQAVPAASLLPLLPLLGALREQSPVGRPVPGSRRALDRWRLVQRFAALKREDPERSNLDVLKQVAREAGRIAPGMRGPSVRTLQWWVQRYNAIGDDGLAAGPAALLDRYGRRTANEPRGSVDE